MLYCYPCQRSFSNEQSYYQHIDNSPAHQESEVWVCDYCDRGFFSERSRLQHHRSAASHPYCVPCDRMFMNDNNLRMHQHSRQHQGSSLDCPFCNASFTTASGVVIHLEFGSCPSGLDRYKINDAIRRLDRDNIITRPMLTMPGNDRAEYMATEAAWNGWGYECCLCHREFGSLHGLNNHLKSPAHEQNIYHCPKKSCRREFKALSGLVQHVESETCGVMAFRQMQDNARDGLEAMVGSMIAY